MFLFLINIGKPATVMLEDNRRCPPPSRDFFIGSWTIHQNPGDVSFDRYRGEALLNLLNITLALFCIFSYFIFYSKVRHYQGKIERHAENEPQDDTKAGKHQRRVSRADPR